MTNLALVKTSKPIVIWHDEGGWNVLFDGKVKSFSERFHGGNYVDLLLSENDAHVIVSGELPTWW